NIHFLRANQAAKAQCNLESIPVIGSLEGKVPPVTREILKSTPSRVGFECYDRATETVPWQESEYVQKRPLGAPDSTKLVDEKEHVGTTVRVGSCGGGRGGKGGPGG